MANSNLLALDPDHGWFKSVPNASEVDGSTSARMLVSQSSAAPAFVAMSGDATMSAAGAVTIANDAVTAAKALAFASTEQTGTGSEQNVAHGLAATPSLVLIAVTESDGNAFDVAEGTHTSTNVVVTVTSGVKFKVLAWA